MDSGEMNLASAPIAPTQSLFERCNWLYAFCREYLFRDQTPEISQALFGHSEPTTDTRLLEIGCGPGLYACRFGQKYPQIQTTGVDLSHALLKRARSRARKLHLTNCSFHEGDAQQLSEPDSSVDAVIVSRLFLIVPNKEKVLAELFRVLRPGGRCFIAEPTSAFTTRLPLIAMWLQARLSGVPLAEFREPRRCVVMSSKSFTDLIRAQPWASVDFREEDLYQYAICEKGVE